MFLFSPELSNESKRDLKKEKRGFKRKHIVFAFEQPKELFQTSDGPCPEHQRLHRSLTYSIGNWFSKQTL